MKYILKVEPIEAFQWDGESEVENCEFTSGSELFNIKKQLKVPSPDTLKYASKGDYITTDKNGVMRIVRQEDFERDYILYKGG